MTSYDSLKDYVLAGCSVSLGAVSALEGSVEVTWQRVSPVYRLYNIITSEHLFTTSKIEYDSWVAKDVSLTDFWVGEGISWLAPTSGTVVHRFYNAALGAQGHSSHYYTADTAEMEILKNNGWVDDGADQQFYSGGTTAIYTSYNEALGSSHHYTTSKTEWKSLASHNRDSEVTKNGSLGVFQGVSGTSWSSTGSRYRVVHILGDKGETLTTEWYSGNAGEMTNAKTFNVYGYQVANVSKAVIAADNSTVVTVTYEKADLTLKFYDFDGSGSIKTQTVKYQEEISLFTPANTSSKTFAGWYYDGGFKKPLLGVSLVMQGKNVTLYAKWVDIKEDPVTPGDEYTYYTIKHCRITPMNDSGDFYPDIIEEEIVDNVKVGTSTRDTIMSHLRYYEGYSLDEPGSKYILPNGETVVWLYYQVGSYNVKIEGFESGIWYSSPAFVFCDYGGYPSEPQIEMLVPHKKLVGWWQITDRYNEIRKEWIQTYVDFQWGSEPVTYNIRVTPKFEDTPTEELYTITFDGNGATNNGGASTQARRFGDGWALAENRYGKCVDSVWYKFNCWEGPDGKSYADGYIGDISGVVDGQVTLKAIWSLESQ